MSSTNRGTERIAQDAYPTPLSAFLPLLKYLPKVPIWEPACGDARLIHAMRNFGFEASGDDIGDSSTNYDFLKDDMTRRCIVTNPPYSLAFEFCQHAVEHADYVFLLLRLNFLASQKRLAWFRAHEPSALFVLSQRPKFVNGTSDSCDYGWVYWHNGIGPVYWKGIIHL